jgi:2',3'-cyclic-nucleotide 2'-phosphodiesterase (5'-nucleotidase family)
VSLRLLHYADVEHALDDPERAARLAGLLAERRAATDDPTLVLGGGDCTGPGVLSLVTDGRHALDFFEAVESDADALGNHDFDHGFDGLRDLLADAPQPWVASNVRFDGQRFAAAHTTDRLLLDAGPATVGVLGVLDPEMATFAPHLAPLDLGGPVAAVDDRAPDLRRAGADYLVVLSHARREWDERLARETDADVVLAAHTHVERAGHVGDTLVTEPPGGGRHVVEVTLDSERDPVATGTVRSVADADAPPDSTPDSTLRRALRERITDAGLDEVVGHVADPVVRDREATRVAESRVGNLVADAHRWAADADVGVVSPGFVRTGDPLADDVRRLDLAGVTPFGGHLVALDLSGDRLCDLLGQLAVGATSDDLPDSWVGHVSGATVRWRGSDGAPDTLFDAAVGGEPVDDDATYRVGTAEYHVVVDHVFPALREADVVERLGPPYATLVEYVEATGLAPEVEGRVEWG